jgi:hypothetical protein
MTSNILQLLEAWPDFLFGDHCGVEDDMAKDILKWFLVCTTSSQDAVRSLACKVAKRLFGESNAVRPYYPPLRSYVQSLVVEFWRRR